MSVHPAIKMLRAPLSERFGGIGCSPRCESCFVCSIVLTPWSIPSCPISPMTNSKNWRRRALSQALMSAGGSSLDSVSPGLTEHAQWLTKTVAHLSACQQVRETIGWEEIAELIDPSWLKGKGFGMSTPVDIGALKGKLISEPVPRTSCPPKPAPVVEPTISYVEAHGRVGHAQFGNVFGLSLTEDERYDLEAGPWQASSVTAYRSAQEKAKKIEWRHNQVDAWLTENGLIDPMYRQHGLAMPPIPRESLRRPFSQCSESPNL